MCKNILRKEKDRATIQSNSEKLRTDVPDQQINRTIQHKISKVEKLIQTKSTKYIMIIIAKTLEFFNLVATFDSIKDTIKSSTDLERG